MKTIHFLLSKLRYSIATFQATTRIFNKQLVLVAILANMCYPIVLNAMPLTWQLNNVAFSDGGTATGSFVYDADSNAVITWNISVAGGDIVKFPPKTYSSAEPFNIEIHAQESDFAKYFDFIKLDTPNGGQLQFGLNPNAMPTNSGGTIFLLGGNVQSLDSNTSQGPYTRLMNSGEIIAILETPFRVFGIQQLNVKTKKDSISLKSGFTLDKASNGINLVTEALTLKIGSFSLTIPAGSFKKETHENYIFEGIVAGVEIKAVIKLKSNNRLLSNFNIDLDGVDVSKINNPVTVELIIGDDSGTTSMIAHILQDKK